MSTPQRQSSTDSMRRNKSIEEREEEYEKTKARIFNQDVSNKRLDAAVMYNNNSY